jgi:hypothetical protein
LPNKEGKYRKYDGEYSLAKKLLSRTSTGNGFCYKTMAVVPLLPGSLGIKY